MINTVFNNIKLMKFTLSSEPVSLFKSPVHFFLSFFLSFFALTDQRDATLSESTLDTRYAQWKFKDPTQGGAIHTCKNTREHAC